MFLVNRKRGDRMDFSVDWDNLPVMDGEVTPRPLKAVSLLKMDRTGLRMLTTADNFKEMDKYIRDYSATGHNRTRICVLTARWKVEENFKGFGVMVVPLRIDRKLSLETDICEKALMQDIFRQCKFIREDTSDKREAKHTNALAASLYCLDGLREPFLTAIRSKWERSSEEFSSRYVRGENGQGKHIPAILDVKTGKKTAKKQKNAKTMERDGLKKTL